MIGLLAASPSSTQNSPFHAAGFVVDPITIAAQPVRQAAV